MKLRGDIALKNVQDAELMSRYPSRDDQVRSRAGLLFPSITPSFQLLPGSKVFTVGSCFARNIEEKLVGNYTLPTMQFSVPKEEWAHRPNGLLNEYNPACMSQRLLWAVEKTDTTKFADTFSGMDEACVDLLLSGGKPVGKERANERRRQIDNIYSELVDSSTLIITLGLVECWHDLEAGIYLNRMPPRQEILSNSKRYQFERLGFEESFEFLKKGIGAVLEAGVKNVLLTVSPVPLQTTFSGKDCVVANCYSKAVLREVAEKLVDEFSGRLDYFPSYEITLSGGLDAFDTDHVHVKDNIVGDIVQYLYDSYLPKIP